MLAADDSGLLDPFARVLISMQCQTMQVRAGLGGGWWRGTGRQGGWELSFFQGSQSLFCPRFSGRDVGSDRPDLGGGVEPEGLRGDGFS